MGISCGSGHAGPFAVQHAALTTRTPVTSTQPRGSVPLRAEPWAADSHGATLAADAGTGCRCGRRAVRMRPGRMAARAARRTDAARTDGSAGGTPDRCGRDRWQRRRHARPVRPAPMAAQAARRTGAARTEGSAGSTRTGVAGTDGSAGSTPDLCGRHGRQRRHAGRCCDRAGRDAFSRTRKTPGRRQRRRPEPGQSTAASGSEAPLWTEGSTRGHRGRHGRGLAGIPWVEARTGVPTAVVVPGGGRERSRPPGLGLRVEVPETRALQSRYAVLLYRVTCASPFGRPCAPALRALPPEPTPRRLTTAYSVSNRMRRRNSLLLRHPPRGRAWQRCRGP